MKKLILVLVIAFLGLGYYASKKRENLVSTDEGLAIAIEKENKKLPMTLEGGGTVEKLRVEPGLRVVATATLPVSVKSLDVSKRTHSAKALCKDKMSRWYIDRGVTWVIRMLDKDGQFILKEETKLADCS